MFSSDIERKHWLQMVEQTDIQSLNLERTRFVRCVIQVNNKEP